MKRISLDQAVIEITRRCNMTCAHCLRGPRQNLDISDETLDAFFSHVGSISTLTLSGGEPSIAIDRIRAVTAAIKHHKTWVSSAYIVTNAKHVTTDFLVAVIELFAATDDITDCSLSISSDDFHEPVPPRNIRVLQVLANTEIRENRPNSTIILEGRAKHLRHQYPDSRFHKLAIYKPYAPYDPDYPADMELTIYLNAAGQIINGCDWSYASQKNKKAIQICHVSDFTPSTLIAYTNSFFTEE